MFQGADDPLALLGIYNQPAYAGVSGMDYVGQVAPSGGGCAPAYASPAQRQITFQRSPEQQARVQAHANKLMMLQQLAMAGKVPQIPLGFGSDTVKIPAGDTFSLSPEPSVPMRLTSVYIAPFCSQYFVISTMKVARLDMLAGAESVPAQMFDPNSVHAPLENPILAAGSQVIVAGRNIDSADHLFKGAFMGIDLTTDYGRMISAGM